MTRCKVGDTAIYVGGDSQEIKRFLGHLFKITAAIPPDAVGPFWDAIHLSNGDDGEVADRHLRPIRDPGDDARDETLDWLPSPVETA